MKKTNLQIKAVDPDLKEQFKKYCRSHGWGMSLVIKTFMKQFIEGKIKLTF